MIVDVLPWWERCTYWILGVSGIAYSAYAVFLEGDKYKDIMRKASLSPGWSWVGRAQDRTDNEWWVWLITLPNMILLNAIHVLLSQTCFYFKVSVKLHSCVLLIFDLAAAYVYLGIRVVVLQFIFALMMYAVSLLGSISFVWLTAVAMMSSMKYDVFYRTEVKYLKLLNFAEEFNFLIMSAFFFSRLLSFAIEKIRYRKYNVIQTDTKTHTCHTGHYDENEGPKSVDNSCENTEKLTTDTCKLSSLPRTTNMAIVDCDPSLIDLLFYSFYLPTFIYGPIFIYSDFHTQVKHAFRSSNFSPDVYDIVKKLARIAFWAVFIEFQFHFLYFSAFGLYPKLIDRLSLWAVAGIGYWQLHFFFVKYLVSYGTDIQLSRFDGIVPLAAPRCIGWIYSNTDMWKYFDVGLYNFIKTYIYVPLGGSKAGLLRQIAASSMSFIFVCYWHGLKEEILVWCIGNLLMVSLEATAITLEQTVVGIKLKSHLGPAMWLRLKAFFNVPIFVTSWLYVMFFFFGAEAGWTVVRRLVTKASWIQLVTECIFFTAHIHNARYLVELYNHKQKEMSEQKVN